MENSIKSSISQLFNTYYPYCKYFGISLFTWTENTQLHYSVSSVPTAIFAFRYVTLVLAALFHQSASDIFRENFGEGTKTATENFTENLTAVNAFFMDVLSTTLVYLNRYQIVVFHNQLVSFLVKQVESAKRYEVACDKFLKQACKILRRLRGVIFAGFLYQVISLQFWNLRWISSENLKITWKHYCIPIFFLYFSVVNSLKVFVILWPISLLLLFKCSASLIETKLRDSCVSLTFSRNNKDDNARVDNIIDEMEELENLVNSFNKTFGFSLPLKILTLLATDVLFTFTLLTTLLAGNFGSSITSTVELIVNSFALITLCNASYDFEREVR